MDRLCVFAHYDKDNIVDDYVLYYLKALKDIAKYIIFVSDTNLPLNEIEKISSVVDFHIIEKHGEYDFGSYKRGFQLALEKKLTFDELIFANDSCLGPFCSLVPIFEKMNKKNADFWGITENRYFITNENNKLIYNTSPHIQTYFICFLKNVFTSSCFKSFISSISTEEAKSDIIKKYEVELTKLLVKNKFKYSVWIKHFKYTENITINKPKPLIFKYNMPFLKTSLIKNGLFDANEIKINNSKIIYPYEIIENYKKRFKTQAYKPIQNNNLRERIILYMQKNLPVPIFLTYLFIDRKLFSTIRKFFVYIIK